MLTPYDPSVMASVASLEDAHVATKLPAFDEFLSAFEVTSKQHGLNDVFGVAIVHRHSEIGMKQRMFDFGQTLQPFPLDDDAKDLYGAQIRPKSLVLRGSQWKPYEYELGAPNDEGLDAFLDSAKSLIEGFHLEQHVGLRRFTPSDPEELEITEAGGISIKVPWINKETEDESYKTTFWAFPSGGPKLYRCTCVDTGGTRGPDHNHINVNAIVPEYED